MSRRLELVLGLLTGLLGIAGVALVAAMLNQADRSRVVPLMSTIAVLCAVVGLGTYLHAMRDHPLLITVATIMLIGQTAMSFGFALAPAALLALATMVAGWTALCARWYDLTSGPAA